MYYYLTIAFLAIVAIGYFIDYRRNKKQFSDMGKGAIVILVIGVAVVVFLLIVRKGPNKKAKSGQNPRLYEMEKPKTPADSQNKPAINY